jgi:CRP-like cAMP-binding protein
MEADPGSHRYRNHLLSHLPNDERQLLERHLEALTFPRRMLMYASGRRIENVHFVEHGIVSILSVLGDGSGVETATIGYEGMIGAAVFHGMERTAEQAMVQVPGHGFRLSSGVFRSLLPQLPALTALLHRYAVYLFTFAAQNSACNRKHSAEQRLSRWLLTVRDRMGTPEFELTHDFMSQMLGVRRATVTDVLAEFEGRGLVRTARARITITDPPGLQGMTCECYAVLREALAAYLTRDDGPRVHQGTPLAIGETSTIGDDDEPVIPTSPT